MVNAWMKHMKPYIAEEKKHAKKEGRKFTLKKAIDAAKKTWKKGGADPEPNANPNATNAPDNVPVSNTENKMETGGRKRRGGKTRRRPRKH